MRKAFSLLIGLLVLGVSIPAQAITLEELRADAPDRLTITVDGPNGSVDVDVPVIIPEVAVLPIVQAQSMPVNNLAAYTYYNALDSLDAGNSTTLSEHCVDGLFLQFPHWSKRKTYIPDKFGGMTGSYRAPSLAQTLENNSLPYGTPANFLSEVLALSGASDADVRIVSQVAYGPAYKARRKRVADPDIADVAVPDFEKPTPGAEMGYWAFRCMQYLNGIPIFPEHYQIGVPDTYGKGGESSEGLHLYGDMVTQEDALIVLELLEQTEVMEAMPDLASFKTVQLTLESRIRSGTLLDVRSITLGYMPLLAETLGEGNEIFLLGNKRFVLIPVWQIRGTILRKMLSISRVTVSATAAKYPTTWTMHCWGTCSYELMPAPARCSPATTIFGNSRAQC